MPFQQEVNRPNGKDIIKDYTSEDGNTKYHAEFHYNTGTHVKMHSISFIPYGFWTKSEGKNPME